MRHELTEADLAMQQQRTESRLIELGLSTVALEGAKIIDRAQVLITIGEDGVEQLVLMDSSLATDRRIMAKLPHEDPPKQIKPQKKQYASYDWASAIIDGRKTAI